MENENKNQTNFCRSLSMIKKGAQKYVSEIPRNLCLAEIQKIVLNSTALIFLLVPFHSKRNFFSFSYFFFFEHPLF